MTVQEAELKGLMVAGLRGDSAAHRALLERLSRHLRAYYKGRLGRIGRSVAEAEDLCPSLRAGTAGRSPCAPWRVRHLGQGCCAGDFGEPAFSLRDQAVTGASRSVG